tara:strand:+ start:578 stop:859 length:282 start_codon:yes stop_codon:yes gene_type:complete
MRDDAYIDGISPETKQAIINDLTKFTYRHYTVLLWAIQETTLEEYTPHTPLTDETKILYQYWDMRNNPIRFGSRYPKVLRGVLQAWMSKELSE